MAYQYYNPNPCKKNVGDCVIRAIAMAFDVSWNDAYTNICLYGIEKCDIPSSNSLWGSYLKEHGFKVRVLPDSCPSCYSVIDFVAEHPIGTYVLATGSHVVTAVNGDYYDSWDSGNEIVAYYFEKENDDELSSV